LWRQKEQFSDGVGYSWIDGCARLLKHLIHHVAYRGGCYRLRLKDHAERSIPDEIFEKRFERWLEDTPDTKEAYYLRDLFDGEIV